MTDQPLPDPDSDYEKIEHVDQPAVRCVAARDGNDDSWLLHLEQSSTDGYGTADVSASGVDRSQLRHNLRLTPTERLEQMVAFVRFVLPLQGALLRKRD